DERVVLSAQRIARGIMGEWLVAAAEIVERLAQGEFDMKTIIVLDLITPEDLFHRVNVTVRKLEGLEVREAPPNLPQSRVNVGGLSVGRNRLVLPADRFEHVGVGHERPRPIGCLADYLLVKLKRLIEVTEPGEGGCVKAQVAGTIGLRRDDFIEQRKRFGSASQSAQDHRQID